jgi:hypothetical protein
MYTILSITDSDNVQWFVVYNTTRDEEVGRFETYLEARQYVLSR